MLTLLGTFATAAYLLAFTMAMWFAFCILFLNPSSPLTRVETHPVFFTAIIMWYTHWYNEYIARCGISIYVDMGPNNCILFAVEDYTFFWPFFLCFPNPILLPGISRSYGLAFCSTLHILSFVTLFCHYIIFHAEQRLETTFYIPFSNNTICAPRNGFVLFFITL